MLWSFSQSDHILGIRILHRETAVESSEQRNLVCNDNFATIVNAATMVLHTCWV